MDTNGAPFASEEPPILPEHTESASDSESDFGSFGSFDQDENDQDSFAPTTPTIDYTDPKERETLIKRSLEAMFEHPAHPPLQEDQNNQNILLNQLLSDRSNELYSRLSDIPHLRPPNWTRLVVRHRLLVNLGIPVNLDEITTAPASQELAGERRKSVNAAEIDWNGLDIPDYNELHLDAGARSHHIENTLALIDRIEAENMENSSLQYLESASVENLKAKLQQYQRNASQLRTSASVWRNELSVLQNDFEIYESVVQNLIGHSQRLRRDELLQRNKK